METFTEKAINGLSSAQEYLEVISTPINDMRNVSDKGSTHTSRLYEENRPWTETKVGEVVGSMDDFYVVYKKGIEEIANVGSEFNETISTLNTTISLIVDEIGDALDVLNLNLVDKKFEVKGSLRIASNKLIELNNTLTSFENNIEYIETLIKDYSEVRRIILLILTIIVLTCSGLGVLAVITYWTPVAWDDFLIQTMNVTWLLGEKKLTFNI